MLQVRAVRERAEAEAWARRHGRPLREDYRFGFYDGLAQVWDEIAFNAPLYLICISAGNDRGDNHSGGHYVFIDGQWTWSTDSRDPDGGATGYDCVGGRKCAKNVLTIGAVSDVTGGYGGPGTVVMSSFSGWGPTDDGRIKPDVVGNGISLFSCDDDSDSDYAIFSGTSMASPNVAGSMAPLIELDEVLIWAIQELSLADGQTLTQSCTGTGGDIIVSITDFLDLLAHWNDCP